MLVELFSEFLHTGNKVYQRKPVVIFRILVC